MHQLVPTREGPGLAAGAVFLLQPGKMMSRNKFKHLLKDCVTMGLSPNYPCWGLGKVAIQTLMVALVVNLKRWVTLLKLRSPACSWASVA